MRSDFWLLGEAIHGDYRRLAGPEMLDSVTNYEIYKGLHSSHNDRNYFEIAYSLNRQFGQGGIYHALPLYNFADNHDVNRVASTLRNPAHLYPLYALLFTIPGVPSVYDGSEWGLRGVKGRGDDRPLRPELRLAETAQDAPHPDLVNAIARLARIRHQVPALRRGGYRQLHVGPEHLVFAREIHGACAVVAVNAAESPAQLEVDAPAPEGSVFTDALDPHQRFTVTSGRLRIDAVPSCWARILVTPVAE